MAPVFRAALVSIGRQGMNQTESPFLSINYNICLWFPKNTKFAD